MKISKKGINSGFKRVGNSFKRIHVGVTGLANHNLAHKLEEQTQKKEELAKEVENYQVSYRSELEHLPDESLRSDIVSDEASSSSDATAILGYSTQDAQLVDRVDESKQNLESAKAQLKIATQREEDLEKLNAKRNKLKSKVKIHGTKPHAVKRADASVNRAIEARENIDYINISTDTLIELVKKYDQPKDANKLALVRAALAQKKSFQERIFKENNNDAGINLELLGIPIDNIKGITQRDLSELQNILKQKTEVLNPAISTMPKAEAAELHNKMKDENPKYAEIDKKFNEVYDFESKKIKSKMKYLSLLLEESNYTDVAKPVLIEYAQYIGNNYPVPKESVLELMFKILRAPNITEAGKIDKDAWNAGQLSI